MSKNKSFRFSQQTFSLYRDEPQFRLTHIRWAVMQVLYGTSFTGRASEGASVEDRRIEDEHEKRYPPQTVKRSEEQLARPAPADSCQISTNRKCLFVNYSKWTKIGRKPRSHLPFVVSLTLCMKDEADRSRRLELEMLIDRQGRVQKLLVGHFQPATSSPPRPTATLVSICTRYTEAAL